MPENQQSQDSNYAVIDLGSNTFHILIYQLKDQSFITVHKEREYVFLSEAGVKKIGEQAFSRGLETLHTFHELCMKHTVQKVKIIGTATLRSASNGPLFCDIIKDKYGWDIDLITGDQEAQYIYQGILLSRPPLNGLNLIMDIGGGSVEFIILNKEEPLFMQSFPVGISILQSKFHKTEPITSTEIIHTNMFLSKQLEPLAKFIKYNPIKRLIGASGSFELLKLLKLTEDYNEYCSWVTKEDYQRVATEITRLTYEERLSYPGLPEKRAKHIVVALALIDFVLDMTQPNQIMISDYAVKEGVIYEHLRNF